MTDYVLTYRGVKGSNLIESEFDGNTHNLDDRVTVLEATASGLSSVVSAEIDTTNHLILVLSNDDTIDCGDISDLVPSFIDVFKGTWTVSTSYAVNDLITYRTSLYVVTYAHISDSTTFDPGANDGNGHDYYQLVVGPLGVTEVDEITALTYTLTADDNLKYFRCTGSDTDGTTVITIPSNAEIPLSINCEISFRQCGNNLNFEAASDVTLNVPAYHSADTDHEGAVITLKKIAADEWDIFGALVVVSA